MPKITFDKSRFKLPDADVVVVGNRTIFKNFKNVASVLNREPEHLMKYLLRELGAAGNIEGAQASFQGKFSGSTIDERIEHYAEEFVFCQECNKPDTRLVKQGRAHMIKCEACGARASIRSI